MTPPGLAPLERLFRRVSMEDITGCLLFTGSLRNGYSVIGDGRSTIYGHRMAYEAARGPIPAGMQIDHLCGDRRCVNVEHLEAVTQAENLRRSVRVREANRKARAAVLPVTDPDDFDPTLDPDWGQK